MINNYQTAIFECLVNGSNEITVMWEKDKEPFSTSNKMVKTRKIDNGVISNLTLDRATVNDSGKYRCKATNVDEDSVVSVEAELISKPLYYSLCSCYCNIMLVQPQILMDPNDTIVLIGQSVRLTCKALGTDIVYQWMKDDAVVSDANSNMLGINNIAQSDEGMYKCVASNKGGMVKSKPATITVYGK